MKIARLIMNENEYYGIVKDNLWYPLQHAKRIDGIENFISDPNFNFDTSSDGQNLMDIDIQWLPPLYKPGKIICIGRNYLAHSLEAGREKEEKPLLFSKYSTSLTHHLAKIEYPKHTKFFDYEVELAVIIGKKATKVNTDPLDYVFGYTIANDLTARDVQRDEKQWTLGKAFDNSLPLGPTIVTKDEVKDPNNLEIWLTVNGEKRQLSNTSNMIFDVKYLITYISQFITLEPGDIILTGTPSGVGFFMEPDGTLKRGDEIACGITNIGELRFSVV